MMSSLHSYVTQNQHKAKPVKKLSCILMLYVVYLFLYLQA